MPRHRETDPVAIQNSVPPIFMGWARRHADGRILTVRSYDPADEYQRIGNVRIDPDIDLELASLMGRLAMNDAAYSKLSRRFQEDSIEALVFDRHRQAKNTLFATLHWRNVMDTAITQNNLFVTSGGNPELADINDIVVNPMMAYLDIGGAAVYKVLRASGGVDEALPIRSAKKSGMDKDARGHIYKTTSEALDDRLRKGVAVHWSLTGTRGSKIMLADGSMATSIPKVTADVADYVVKHVDKAVPVPMDWQKLDTKVEVMNKTPLETVGDIHKMMEGMVELIGDLSDDPIYYGMPKGAQEVLEFDAEL